MWGLGKNCFSSAEGRKVIPEGLSQLAKDSASPVLPYTFHFPYPLTLL